MKLALVVSAMILASVVLPTAGRSPEDHGCGVVALDLHAERLAGAEQMLLADVFIERARSHALGERGISGLRGQVRGVAE